MLDNAEETVLTEADLAAVKAGLETRRDEIKALLSEIDHRLREKAPDDFAERASEREEDEVLEELGTTDAHELEEIEHALQRIDLGTYGVCTHCGEPIAEGRLKALPYAALCIKCA